MTCVGQACELAHRFKGTDDKSSSRRAGSSGHMSFNIPPTQRIWRSALLFKQPPGRINNWQLEAHSQSENLQ